MIIKLKEIKYNSSCPAGRIDNSGEFSPENSYGKIVFWQRNLPLKEYNFYSGTFEIIEPAGKNFGFLRPVEVQNLTSIKPTIEVEKGCSGHRPYVSIWECHPLGKKEIKTISFGSPVPKEYENYVSWTQDDVNKGIKALENGSDIYTAVETSKKQLSGFMISCYMNSYSYTPLYEYERIIYKLQDGVACKKEWTEKLNDNSVSKSEIPCSIVAEKSYYAIRKIRISRDWGEGEGRKWDDRNTVSREWHLAIVRVDLKILEHDWDVIPKKDLAYFSAGIDRKRFPNKISAERTEDVFVSVPMSYNKDKDFNSLIFNALLKDFSFFDNNSVKRVTSNVVEKQKIAVQKYLTKQRVKKSIKTHNEELSKMRKAISYMCKIHIFGQDIADNWDEFLYAMEDSEDPRFDKYEKMYRDELARNGL